MSILPRCPRAFFDQTPKRLKLSCSFRSQAWPPIDYNPYRYEGGRWLCHDKENRRGRYLRFDFDSLCRKVIALSPGAKAISRSFKIDASHNRVFEFKLDNDAVVVARVPYRVTGPARLTTNSEVATIEYVRRNTSVPTPKILEWSDDATNEIGAEYIIMSHAPGINLADRWPSMKPTEQMSVVRSLGRIVEEMSQLEFPAYGSMYFDDAPVERSELIPLGGGFSIGPHCGRRYWPGNPGDERTYERRPINVGPWRSHQEYCRSLTAAADSRIPSQEPPVRPEHKGTVAENLRIVKSAEEVLLRMCESHTVQSVSRPMLQHFHPRKEEIFVAHDDPTEITCIVDWQSSCIEPAWHYADDIPDVCDLPRNFDESDIEDGKPTPEQQEILQGVAARRQLWEAVLLRHARELHMARSLDQDFLRIFRYIPGIWLTSATFVRHDMMAIAQNWSGTLGMLGTCPYQPTAEEIERHPRLYDDAKTASELRDTLCSIFHTNSDGWVPVSRWRVIQEVHEELHQQLVDTVDEDADGEMMTQEMGREYWPFDIPPTFIGRRHGHL